MNEMVITVSSAKKAPDYRKTASLILAACREFYREPENKKAFMESKTREEKTNERHEEAV